MGGGECMLNVFIVVYSSIHRALYSQLTARRWSRFNQIKMCFKFSGNFLDIHYIQSTRMYWFTGGRFLVLYLLSFFAVKALRPRMAWQGFPTKTEFLREGPVPGLRHVLSLLLLLMPMHPPKSAVVCQWNATAVQGPNGLKCTGTAWYDLTAAWQLHHSCVWHNWEEDDWLELRQREKKITFGKKKVCERGRERVRVRVRVRVCV